jgi:FlaG/FlaF family flagellin (archaellin)
MNNEYRNSGISPVVGVVLLVLIVILISGIFGVLVTEFSPTEEPVTAGVNIDQTNDGVEVKWISPGSADELQIQVNGSDQIKLYDTGQSTKIKTDKGEKITVIGKSEGGNESVITNEDTSRKTSSFGDTEVVSGPMPEGTEVTGTVTVNPPVENAEVQVVHNGVVGRTTTTDVDGEYTVNAPEGSKIRVLVEGFTNPAISNPLYASYEKSYTASGPVNFDFTDTKTTTIDGNSILVSNTVSNPSSSEKQIGLTEQLSSIRTAPDDSYKLIRDIDASKTNSWNSGFDPILDCTGGDTTLDGNGHKISNLTITNSSDCTGLFGSMGSNGAIKDITLEDISVTGEKYTGGLIGENNGGDVSNVNVGGSISGEDQTGGLIGNNSGSITEVQVDADVSGDAYTGGVFGVNYDVVSESNSAGETSGEKLVGGIVGYNSGTVEDTSATGKVTASQSWVGGLIGQSNGTITNSYSESSVTGSNQVGGLVGRLHSSSSSLSGSYATGTVNGSGNFVGGLVGYLQGSITDAYSEGETNANKYVGGLVGYSTSDLSNVHSSSNVEADSLFAGGLVGYSTAKISDSYAEGTVKSDSWAGGLVANAKDDIENSHATGNIEASTLAGGLIAKTNSSVSNSYATGNVTLTGPRAGGLIGETRNPVGEPTPTVTDSYAEGTVTGDDDVGGLIGRSNSDINNSHATGNVSGDSTDIGGLLGSASNNINNSHATGTVEGGTNVGGLIGRYNGGTIDTSYAEGSETQTMLED